MMLTYSVRRISNPNEYPMKSGVVCETHQRRIVAAFLNLVLLRFTGTLRLRECAGKKSLGIDYRGIK
jgi:hypothetical protein